ncbi:MAG TPA: aspartate--tRNA ligase [Planctomycetota bacterium]|nr:aspartate--tRNA ligase [Planctomycetota bacterium]
MTSNPQASTPHQSLETLYRSHSCGALTAADVGATVKLAGWAANRRDFGGLIFIDLRDRYGITQVVVDPQRASKETHAAAESVRMEFVLGVTGKVQRRLAGKENPNLPTGQIEVIAEKVEVLSVAQTPPFEITDRCKANEDLRLKYRYLDLRRPEMNARMVMRHRVALAVRDYLSAQGFVEIETPILAKSTPEGARDYLVPSRLYHGKFYALPQSPQLFKQLLMVAGFDRYFQIAKCMRDEDLRGNRQPEFTQIDLEMSYAGQEDVFRVTEGMMAAAFKAGINYDLKVPFARLTYKECMDRFGSDKPDLRFGLELREVSDLVKDAEFKVFREAVAKGGIVKGLAATGAGAYSRKQIDDLTAAAAVFGARGLAWLKLEADGKASGPIAKFFAADLTARLVERLGGKPGDLLLFVADSAKVANNSLSAVRSKLGADLGLAKDGEFACLWVTDFPLFAWDEEEKRWASEHHPFTAPNWDDLQHLDTDPAKVRSQSYDLVINDWEMASGSVRIHDSRLQKKIFEILKLSEDEIQKRFGFFTEALSYGTPPHAGIAPGLDRLLARMLSLSSIAEIMAFPKTQRAIDAMTGAPGDVSERQLKELGIVIPEEEQAPEKK